MRLGTARFLKVLLSSLFVQTSWSFFSMQTMGFLYTLSAGARGDDKRVIIKTHRSVFNTHPYMASYIIGAVLRLYDDHSSQPEEINRFISIAQTSFASAGDLLFWRTIRPAVLLFSAILAMHAGIVGPIAFLIVYSIFHIYHRAKGIQDGYERGTDVIYLLKSKRFAKVSHLFEISGALLSGLLLSFISPGPQFLFIVPLATFFTLMIYKRFSYVLIMITIILVILIIIMV